MSFGRKMPSCWWLMCPCSGIGTRLMGRSLSLLLGRKRNTTCRITCAAVSIVSCPVRLTDGTTRVQHQPVRVPGRLRICARGWRNCAIDPLAAWCVNPMGHREDTGCGRLLDVVSNPGAKESDDSTTEDADQDAVEATLRMATVSGTWKVMPGNIFELEQPMAPWSGRDTIRWSGGQSLQLLPLDRSFILEPSIAELELEDGASEAEVEEVIIVYLDSGGLAETSQQLADAAESEMTGSLDSFYMVCWDAVIGEGVDSPWQFAGFLAALRHLAAYEREHDREHRASGVASCSHIGFAGSGNAEAEGLRSERFQLGLRRLGIRVVRDGYRPGDAADLVALCNGVLSTLHVDYAGFAKICSGQAGQTNWMGCFRLWGSKNKGGESGPPILTYHAIRQERSWWSTVSAKKPGAFSCRRCDTFWQPRFCTWKNRATCRSSITRRSALKW